MKIALAQTDIVWENKETNYEKAERLIIKASEEGADLIVFPEMSMTGFSMHIDKIGEEKDNFTTIGFFSRLAINYHMNIGVGYVERDGEKGKNRYVLIDTNGQVLCDYIKIHPFTFGREGEYYVSGDSLSFAEMKGFTIAPLICYDLRFPELFQSASKKADMILVPANWPSTRIEAWEIFLRARAMENQCYIVGVNRVGNGGKLEYNGHSMAVDPSGNIMNPISEEEDLIFVQTDKNTLLSIREEFPTKKDRKEYVYKMLGIQGENNG